MGAGGVVGGSGKMPLQQSKADDANGFEEAGDGEEGQKVVVRRGIVVPGSRGCLWLAPFALDGLQFSN